MIPLHQSGFVLTVGVRAGLGYTILPRLRGNGEHMAMAKYTGFWASRSSYGWCRASGFMFILNIWTRWSLRMLMHVEHPHVGPSRCELTISVSSQLVLVASSNIRY
ncbi:hypothetical protein VTN00DRAFT_5561 [Thermoascus crustaceus]|uniref:uncharacterized protein n=1 Tax=Thermoascus crustaceus TaxID=5088 RepID=UPI0037441437